MKTLRFVRLSVGFTAALVATSATAANPAAAQGVALDRFDPAPAGDRLFGVASPYVAGELTPRAMLLFDYAHEPLVLRNDVDNTSLGAVVGSQLLMHVDVSLALFHRLNLDVDVPVAIYQAGDSPTLNGAVLVSPNKAQFADVRLGARLRLFGEYEDPFQIAVAGNVWLPTGASGAFVGDGSVRGMPQLVLGGKTDRLVWSFAGGALISKAEAIATLVQGTMVKAGGGAGVLLGGERQLQLGPEVSFSMVTAKVSGDGTGAEVLLGARYRFLRDFEAGVAAGPGFGGAGTPVVRGVAMLAYSPPEKADRDRDGIADKLDACPDRAGVLNADPKKHGCPPPGDRDRDGMVDEVDACPDEVGVASEDPKKHGCPFRDRDGDTIADDADACADLKGVRSADPKENGCPGDTDGDGIRDDGDACLTLPGVKSADPMENGCPPDTDGDGVRDDVDACPQEKGRRSEDPKQNGCLLVVLRESEIEIREQIQFELAETTIKGVSDTLLDRVTEVIKGHPEIVSIEVQGHTDNVGTERANQVLSAGRAEAVRKALIKRGVEGKRLRSKGFGQSVPLGDNATEAGRTVNRRVQFKILEKKKVLVTVP